LLDEVDTVRQRNDGATTTHIILGRSAENAIGDFLETVVIRRALARAEIVDRRAQRFAIAGQLRQHFDSRDQETEKVALD
jgi:hypothetical protein